MLISEEFPKLHLRGRHATIPGQPDNWGYLHFTVDGYDETHLSAPLPWSGLRFKFDARQFNTAEVEQAKRIVHSGKGRVTISVPSGADDHLALEKAQLTCVEDAEPQDDFDFTVIPSWPARLMDEEAENVILSDQFTSSTLCFGALARASVPTNQEEASHMTLFNVILIDPRDGAICIDTKRLAKTPEQAKLKAGVYRWLEEAEMELDDVTVAVTPLIYGVKVAEKA